MADKREITRRDFLKLVSAAGATEVLDLITRKKVTAKASESLIKPSGMDMTAYFEQQNFKDFNPPFNAIETVGCFRFDQYATRCESGGQQSFVRSVCFGGMPDVVFVDVSAAVTNNGTEVTVKSPFFEDTCVVQPDKVAIASINASQKVGSAEYQDDKRIAVAKDPNGNLLFRVWRR
jgi:hypothetical protein